MSNDDANFLASSSHAHENDEGKKLTRAEIRLRNDEMARKAAAKHCEKKHWFGRITSQIWDMDSFDPFQSFMVTQKKCHILTVNVTHGTNITKGWLHDLVDTPDPYLILSVPGTPNGKKRTKTIDNSVNPVWNETFQYFLDSEPKTPFSLELVLMDANYTLDTDMGNCTLSLSDVVIDTEVTKQATFVNGSKVFVKILITENENPDIRYSLALSDDEKNFLQERRVKVMQAMTQLFGKEDSPTCPKEVPVIGLLGSGGGFRAMTAMSGVCHALQDEGILDCVMYMAGLSGSSWYLSHLYSQPDFSTKSIGELQEVLREAVSKNWHGLLTPTGIYRYSAEIMHKLSQGQPVSFTDVFGHLVGDMLLGPQLKNTKLSDQRKCLEQGAAPLPLYTCLNVKKDVSARVFQDWFEFSPYEVGIAKYGAFMRPELFGSKFYVGKLLKKFDEPPLHFLQGIWGSAYCTLNRRPKCEEPDLKTKDKSGKQMRNEKIASSAKSQAGTILCDVDESHCASGSSDEQMEDHSSDDESEKSTVVTKSRSEKTAHGVLSTKKSFGAERLQRQNAIIRDTEVIKHCTKNQPAGKPTARGKKAWQERRKTRRKIKEEKHQSIWTSIASMLTPNSLVETIEARAGLIFNPLRGLNITKTFPFSPFSPTTPEDETDFKGFYEPTESRAKKLYLVDSGLTFNLPFPLLLRPQRAVDLYLSFDFSERTSDETHPFKEILRAESWAKLNHVPFPPVSRLVQDFEKEAVRELYVFEDPTDPYCPVILHFHIFNKQFKEFKAPGIRRTTKEEIDFGNFPIFSDPNNPFTCYKFQYSNEEFNRISQLMEFNVRLGMDDIKKHIKKAIICKQSCLKTLQLAQVFGPKWFKKCNRASEHTCEDVSKVARDRAGDNEEIYNDHD